MMMTKMKWLAQALRVLAPATMTKTAMGRTILLIETKDINFWVFIHRCLLKKNGVYYYKNIYYLATIQMQ